MVPNPAVLNSKPHLLLLYITDSSPFVNENFRNSEFYPGNFTAISSQFYLPKPLPADAGPGPKPPCRKTAAAYGFPKSSGGCSVCHIWSLPYCCGIAL